MIESSQNEADPAGGPGTALAEPEILLGSGQRAPRRARGQLRVEALLASAAEVFARKGFDAATMTEIAAQADSSIGSLYQFFRTKEAVAEALLQLQIAGLWERFDALGERAAALPTTRLGAELARLLVDFRAAHPSFATLVEMPGPPLKAVTGVRRRVRDGLDLAEAARRVRDLHLARVPQADRAEARQVEQGREQHEHQRGEAGEPIGHGVGAGH